MPRKQPYIDELGRDAKGVNHDDAPGPRLSLQLVETAPTENTHGLPQHVIDGIVAAHEAEDDLSETELDQRRFEMERALAAAEKDKLLVEMAGIITRIYDAIGIGTPGYEINAMHAARLIAKHPAIGVDQACLMTARFRKLGRFDHTPTKDEVRNWRP